MSLFAKATMALALAGSLLAQQPKKTASDPAGTKEAAESTESKPEREMNFYKLSFTISEVEDGRRLNQRDYTMIGRSNGGQDPMIRVSTRVPVVSAEKQMQYIDAGLDIRCSLHETVPDKLQVACDVNISSFVVPDQGTDNRAVPPILRTTHASSWALLTPGKPAMLSTIDDVNSKKRTQIEVTAARLD
jgi:hypothetical protein